MQHFENLRELPNPKTRLERNDASPRLWYTPQPIVQADSPILLLHGPACGLAGVKMVYSTGSGPLNTSQTALTLC